MPKYSTNGVGYRKENLSYKPPAMQSTVVDCSPRGISLRWVAAFARARLFPSPLLPITYVKRGFRLFDNDASLASRRNSLTDCLSIGINFAIASFVRKKSFFGIGVGGISLVPGVISKKFVSFFHHTRGRRWRADNLIRPQPGDVCDHFSGEFCRNLGSRATSFTFWLTSFRQRQCRHPLPQRCNQGSGPCHGRALGR